MNISSAIVHVRPPVTERVLAPLVAMSGVEIHAASWEGRLVVSIESADDQDTASVFESIQMLDGVLSVSLVYSQFESDPDSAIPVASCPLATPY